MKKTARTYLAFDLGASNGRAVLGTLDRGHLSLKEIGRFPHNPVLFGKTLHWDFFHLWSRMIETLHACAKSGEHLSSVGVDTWGIDFAILARDGSLLVPPVCYRDERTTGMESFIAGQIPLDQFFRLCGQVPTRIMTLSQLLAFRRDAGPDILSCAGRCLLMPDLFRYLLCGKMAAETTIAGTTQLFDIRTLRWSTTVINRFNLPRRLFPPLVQAGVFTGTLKPDLASTTGLGPVPVAAVAGHDTASAAAAAPYAEKTDLFLSSGTWSVLGVMRKQPLLTEEARTAGFVNEPGFGTILFVKNLTGLYLVENLKRAWAKKGPDISYAEMAALAAAAKPFRFFVNMDAPVFFTANDPEAAVKTFLQTTGQRGTPTKGELVRTLLESLAFSYRRTILDLERLTGGSFKRISLVGGGVNNNLLCGMTADATGLTVMAGPAEATAVGNLCIQAVADGRLDGPADVRKTVAASFRPAVHQPRETAVWMRRFATYQNIIERTTTPRR